MTPAELPDSVYADLAAALEAEADALDEDRRAS